MKSRARRLLFGRKAWTAAFVRGVDEGHYSADDVSLDEVRRIALHEDPQLDRLVRKHWGEIRAGTPGEKLAEMRRLNNDLRAASGHAENGRSLYLKHCGNCHQLFGEGNKIGPDLTHANRTDRNFLLASLVDPSAQVRKEFLSYVIVTNDGRVVTGLIVSRTPASITLVDAKNQRITIAQDDIEELRESPVSLMPEKLFSPLKPQELRDLFSYLQSRPSKSK